MGDQLLPFLDKMMPTVIQGLADETEPVRDIAFKASQMIVQQYTHSALDTLLNILEKSLFDDNWRIRQSSILILGHILRIVSSLGAQDESQRKGILLHFGFSTEREYVLHRHSYMCIFVLCVCILYL
jgi:hypothetical protein